MKPICTRFNRASALCASLALMLLPLFTAVLTIAPQSVSAADVPATGSVNMGLPRFVHVTMTATPPVLTAAQRAKVEAATSKSNKPGSPVPVGPNATVKTGPPAVRSFPPPKSGDPNGGSKQQADDFGLFQQQLYGTAAPNGYKAQVPESDVAGTTDTIFGTGNWWAALSINRGSSFSFVNPFTVFPTVNGGFCCDQKILYDPTNNIFIWEGQELTDVNNNNTVHFGIATPANAVLGNWYFYDINGQTAGYPPTTQVELDYPNMAIDNGKLVYTANDFLNGASFSSNGTAFRISLSILANHAAAVWDHFNASFGMVPSQQVGGNTIYLVNHANTTNLNLYTWPDANAAPSGPILLPHSSFNTGAHSCPGPGGSNMCARDDTRVKSVLVTFGFILVAWDVAQGAGGLGTFAMPYEHITQHSLATHALLAEPVISDPNTAYQFGSFAPNGRGNIGGNITFGGGTYNPSGALIIADDFTYGVNWNFRYVTTSGTNGPGIPRWGDYTDVHPVNGNGNAWYANTYDVEGGACPNNQNGCDNVVNRFFAFGRERDNLYFGKESLVGVFRGGVFYMHNASNPATTGSASRDGGNLSVPPTDSSLVFGASGDQPTNCDFSGNGARVPGIYRKSTSLWQTARSYSDPTIAYQFVYGGPNDIGICGDWDGSGHDKPGLYRPDTGQFILSTADAPFPNTAITVSFGAGNNTELPIVGHWRGVGPDTIGIFRKATDQFIESFSNTIPHDDRYVIFGAPGDLPVVGDWNRDGTTTVGVFRPSNAVFHLSDSTSGNAVENYTIPYGISGDTPFIYR